MTTKEVSEVKFNPEAAKINFIAMQSSTHSDQKQFVPKMTVSDM